MDITTGKSMQKNRQTILVVDDVAINRGILGEMFANEYNILEAENGKQALDTLHSVNVDAVLLDIMMPVMDGYEMLRVLHDDPELSRVPVIVVTSAEDEESQTRALNHGAQDVITKPFSAGIVRHSVRNAIRRRESDKLVEEYSVYERLLKQAEIDEKTGIYTKQAFCRKTGELLRESMNKKYVICRWDIDRFKVYNDMFGTEAGDKLLADIGWAFRSNIGGGILVCGHLEADHFVACFEYDSFIENDAFGQLERFVAGLNKNFGFVSRAGVYAVDDHFLDVSLMCDRALLALRSTKNSYTRRVAWYEESMRESLLEEQTLIAEMDSALEGGQFIVYLQPQYNYANNTLVGAEALVRWQHPQKGLIPPLKFVPLFERNGFIGRMDEYVCEQVCILLKSWKDRGLPMVPISVNISRHDLYGGGPGKAIVALLEKYGLDISMLRLEVTETAFMQDTERLISAIDALKIQGFHVEMDDFGSGYSSLNTLKDVCVDTLKLDIKFISSCKNNSRAGRILSSVVRMANWIDLSVIAEGVETKEQADYLKSLGCVHMQGYYFSRPVPADEFEKLLTSSAVVCGESEKTELGIEGTVDFLDASTQATLMFNSFVGGALIVELHDDNVEVLRVNDRFFELIGVDGGKCAGKLIHMQKWLYPESRQAFLDMLRLVISSEREQQCELHVLPFEHAGEDIWLLVHARYLVGRDKRYVLYLLAENITERKELDRTRIRLDNIVQNVPAGIAIYEYRDGELYSIFASDRTCEIFGFEREEYDARVAAGLPVSFMPEKHFEQNIGDIAKEGTNEHIIPARRKDGSLFWLRTICNIKLNGAQPPLLYVTFFDITEQRTFEDEMKVLVQSMPSGILKCSVDEDFIGYISDKMLELLECTRQEYEELYENRFSRLCYGDNAQEIMERIRQQVQKNGQYGALEFRLATKFGEPKWVYAIGHLVKDIEGRTWYYMTVSDFQERKRLETELIEKNRQTEAMIKNAPGGVEIFVIKDGKPIREYVSEGVARLYGCEEAELKDFFGEDVFCRVHPLDAEQVKKAAADVIDEHREFNESYRIRRKDDSYIWVNLTGNPVKGSDGVLRFYCVYTDISDRMMAGEKISIEKQKMEFAIKSAKLLVWEYDPLKKSYTMLNTYRHGHMPQVMENVPESLIESGMVAERSAEDIRALYEAIDSGAETAAADILFLLEDGEYHWQRINLYTVFADGKPVSAIGTAIDISAETEAIARRHALEMALDASSLYFWSYDMKNDIYPVVNKNAARLGIGKIKDGRQCGLRHTGTLEESAEESMREHVEKLLQASETAEKSSFILHMKKHVCGMEWMRVSCAVIRDRDGSVISLSFAGEDYTENRENERTYADIISRLEHGEMNGAFVNMLVDINADVVEAYRGTFGRVGMKYSDAVTVLLERVYEPKRREAVDKTLNLEALKEALLHGKKTMSVEYRRILFDEKLPRWVRTTARMFHDNNGKPKALISSVDIDIEVMNRDIALAVSQNSFELLGIIYVDSGYMRCYHMPALEIELKMDKELSYIDNIDKFINYYISESFRSQAAESMRLDVLMRRLSEKSPVSVVFPVEIQEKIYYKKWEYCWLNEDKRAIVITRSDVTEVEMLRKRSDDMRLALAESRVAVCRYDTATRALSMPDDYAALSKMSDNVQRVDERVMNAVAPGDRQRYRDFYARIDAGESEGAETIQFIFADGSRHYCRAGFITDFDKDGNSVGAVVTVTDVTRQHAQEIENERNRLILEHNGFAIFDYDVSSDTLVFETVIQGKGVKRFVHENYYEYVRHSSVVNPDYVQTLRNAISIARKRPMSDTLEYVADNWGTGYRWCRLLYASVADASGAVYRIVGQITDIQEEKDREALVADLQKHIHTEDGAAVYDPVVLASVLQYLSESLDTAAAIKHVLELLGKHYQASLACIFEYGAKSRRRIFEWHAPLSKSAASRIKLTFEDVRESALKEVFENKHILCCTNPDEMPPVLKERMVKKGIHSLLMSAMIHNGEMIGVIGFFGGSARSFTKTETGTLSVLSGVIALNILRRRGKMAGELSEDFQQMMDNSTLYVYLIDPKTHKVIYRNKSLRDSFGEGADEHVCYRDVAGSDKPCENCPMFNIDSDGRYMPVQVSWQGGLWMLAQASPLRWQGQNVYMVICTDITAQKKAEAQLQTRNTEYVAIVRQSGKQILRYDLATGEGETFYDADMNFASRRKINVSPEELIRSGRIDAQSAKSCRKFFAKMHEGEPSGSCDLCLRSSDGKLQWMHSDYSLIYGADNKPTHAIISYYDNTSEREKEMAYEKWQKSIAKLLSDRAVYLEVNLTEDTIEHEENFNMKTGGRAIKRFSDFVAYSKEHTTYKDDMALFLEFFDRKRLIAMHEAGRAEDHFRYRAKIDGRYQWYRVETQTARYPNTDAVKALIVYTNIDEEMREHERITGEAATDALTGLLNRAAMERMVDELLQNAQPQAYSALFMLDIDNFKTVNDTLGHQQGDDILTKVAKALQSAFRGSDLACRFGGDEFMIFMNNIVGVDIVHSKAQTLLELLQFSVGDIITTVSVGVCMAQARGMTFERFYGVVDRALYSAKRSGKSTYCILDGHTNLPMEKQSKIPADTVQLQMLLRSMDGGIITCTVDGEDIVPTYISPSLDAELTAINPENARMEDLFSLVYKQDVDLVRDALLSAAKSGEKFDIVFRLAPSGERWVRVRGERMPGGDERKTHLMGVLSDITELKKAEETAREHERILGVDRYTSALAGLFDEIYEIDWKNSSVTARIPESKGKWESMPMTIDNALRLWCARITDIKAQKRLRRVVNEGADGLAEKTRVMRCTVKHDDGLQREIRMFLMPLGEEHALLCTTEVKVDET
ncbi:MAG: EAL domain-containing protein [Clostridia bacterium]|nr:EAL domain-containing protein [Clostridia bacterium]